MAHKQFSKADGVSVTHEGNAEAPLPAVTVDEGEERGAVLMIVAMLTIVLLLSAGLAVDLGSWYTRAEELQDAADAAALAGAADYVLGSEDQAAATAKINEVLRQNGFDPTSPDHNVNITFDAPSGLTVSIADDEVETFLASLVGIEMGLGRDASATLDVCGASCVQSLDITPPLATSSIAGSGDGWTPILVGDRVFAINHHSDVATGGDIVCIDRNTEVACDGYPKNISALQPAGTGWVVPTVVSGSRIFYHAQRAQELVLGCFDTGTDEACGGGHIELEELDDPGGDHDYQDRGGAVIMVDERIFVFSETKTHCVDPGAYAVCPGYPQDNGFAESGITGGDLSGHQMFSVAVGEKIYVSHTWFREQTSLGTQISCWDTSDDGTCAGFGSVQVHPTGDPSASGRLFVFYNSQDPPVAGGVCSIQLATVECLDLSGAPMTDPPNFESSWSSVGATRMGSPFWHERSNQLYIPSRDNDTTFCYSFNTFTDCGSQSFGAGYGDYGYASEGDCIYGLGHGSTFWTFDPDLVPGCRSAITEDRIYACICADGTKHWGSVQITADLDSITGPFEKLEVFVTAPAPDGTVYVDTDLVDSDGTLDLEFVPTTHDYLEVQVLVTAKLGQDPWADGNDPAIEIGWRDRPILVE